MLGVVQGFAVILGVIGAGYLAALFGVVKGEQRLVLNKIAFYVAIPALLLTVLSRADPSVVLTPVILVTTVSAVIGAAVFVVASRLWFKRDLATTTLGATSSGYVNAANLGLPVAIYILGDAAYIAPIILIQLLLYAPVVLSILETTRGNRDGALKALGRAASNPIIIASIAGLILSLTGLRIPDVLFNPLELLGIASVPMILLSFGISLRGQRALQPGTGRAATLTASAIKLLLVPFLAWAFAAALGMSPHEIFIATTLAALPTAQNVYNYAATYQRGEVLVRDTVFVTTFASVPIIAGIAFLLG